MSLNSQPDCSLTDIIEISHRDDLFEIVSNEQVTRFSQARGGSGFANAAAVLRLTGVEERRICRPWVTAGEVALTVAEDLQSSFNFSWQDCPAIGVSHTHTNPLALESLLTTLSSELDVPRERFFGINYGCVGFLRLIEMGCERLAELNSDSGPIPLLTVETPDSWHDASDRSFCGIVSAGATGCLLHRGLGHRIHEISVSLREPPIQEAGIQEALFWTEEGEFLNFWGEMDRRNVMRMNGGQVFLQGTHLMIEACRNAWNRVSAFDHRVLVASHQPSGKMLHAMMSVLRDEIPCLEFLNHLARYANSISSTIPVVLSHLGRILDRQGSDPVQRGDFVLLPAAGISMSHKATHMAQGWAVLEW